MDMVYTFLLGGEVQRVQGLKRYATDPRVAREPKFKLGAETLFFVDRSF